MVDTMGCCGLRQAHCHRHDPQKYIIRGEIEIDRSPWFSLCASGSSVVFRLYSQDNMDPTTRKGVESENAYVMKGKELERKKHEVLSMKVPIKVIKFELKFEVTRDFGIPGAFVVENRDKKHEFFLKSVTLHYIKHPDLEERKFHFYCRSWVYPITKTGFKRIFFSDQLYLPKETPKGLVELRKKELLKLQAPRLKGEWNPWDRIYDYDVYNDLRDPEKGRSYDRPVLGDSTKFPYPRRLKTSHLNCQHDHSRESGPARCFQFYVPPDERMSNEKLQELKNNFVEALIRFLAPESTPPHLWDQECPDFVTKVAHFFVPKAAISKKDVRFIRSIIDFCRKLKLPSSHGGPNRSDPSEEQDIFEDIIGFYADKEVEELDDSDKQRLEKLVPKEILDQVVATLALKRQHVSAQLPSIIAEEKFAAFAEEEFGRQMLAGTNPVRIRRLKEEDMEIFQERYPGIELKDLESLLKEPMEANRAFILDHNYFEQFLKMINGKGVCAYATRTILIADESSYETIIPVAIELSLPEDSDGGRSKFLVEANCSPVLWELAKFHVASNDAAYHQLVSHWLHTHAVVEPFIIATRRRLSVIHPIHRLLDPHFKDTLHINALARAIFLNAGGILETLLFTGEYSMELSSYLYKEWRFDKQALPEDLLERGMAKPRVRDEVVSGLMEHVERDKSSNKAATGAEQKKFEVDAEVELVLEDYPYAKDGIEIWTAIETWVTEYCNIFYHNDNDVKEDEEIQEWWNEIQTEGHADRKEGWYDINTFESLVKALTTLIWITSGLHAAVNFGQYGYGGWPPNRPMLLRKFLPKEEEMEGKHIMKFVEEMLPDKFQMKLAIAVMDLLSRHTSDEVYLGQTSPQKERPFIEDHESIIQKKFQEFRENLEAIERNINERNKEYLLMNRWGYAKIPYKLLYPDTSKSMRPTSKEKGKYHPEKTDINERGIPNSISI
ncbi:linoleate 9S-lipoxygenase 5 isoform X2 [Gossypium raimondii]|uniref:linoleate 9S-lipoxygenase 5 isoform X2 n=1 Tax=Gossypium raimondii TaxID=29730 RepID=UPI00227BBC42|nr:linoleate 9S-lipoxygenase 5 isoform X2 [Gossypium raimondii]